MQDSGWTQLAPCGAAAALLWALLNGRVPHAVSKGEPSHHSEDAHFWQYLRSLGHGEGSTSISRASLSCTALLTTTDRYSITCTHLSVLLLPHSWARPWGKINFVSSLCDTAPLRGHCGKLFLRSLTVTFTLRKVELYYVVDHWLCLGFAPTQSVVPLWLCCRNHRVGFGRPVPLRVPITGTSPVLGGGT